MIMIENGLKKQVLPQQVKVVHPGSIKKMHVDFDPQQHNIAAFIDILLNLEPG